MISDALSLNWPEHRLSEPTFHAFEGGQSTWCTWGESLYSSPSFFTLFLCLMDYTDVLRHRSWTPSTFNKQTWVQHGACLHFQDPESSACSVSVVRRTEIFSGSEDCRSGSSMQEEASE